MQTVDQTLHWLQQAIGNKWILEILHGDGELIEGQITSRLHSTHRMLRHVAADVLHESCGLVAMGRAAKVIRRRARNPIARFS